MAVVNSQKISKDKASVSEEVSEMEPEVSEEAAEVPRFDIYKALESKPGAPSKAQVEQWKNAYNGDVFGTILGKGEIFIFRSIKRLEWKEIQAQMQKIEDIDDTFLKEHVIRKCVLYPNFNIPENFALIKAGTIPTLFDQICFYSNFMASEVAIQMVYEL